MLLEDTQQLLASEVEKGSYMMLEIGDTTDEQHDEVNDLGAY